MSARTTTVEADPAPDPWLESRADPVLRAVLRAIVVAAFPRTDRPQEGPAGPQINQEAL
jgi:hypothetical protein